MRDRGKKPVISKVTLVSILLILILVYALYIILGNDWDILSRLTEEAGGGSFVEKIVISLRGFGNGIRNTFTGIMR